MSHPGTGDESFRGDAPDIHAGPSEQVALDDGDDLVHGLAQVQGELPVDDVAAEQEEDNVEEFISRLYTF